MHKAVTDNALLKMEMEKKGLIRVQPDQYNYRSPKKYVSAFRPSNLIFINIFADADFNVLQGLAEKSRLQHGREDAASEDEHQMKRA